MTEPAERRYTAAEVADRFQIHPETVRENIRARKWPCLRLGPRTYRFTDAHLRQIEELAEQAPQAPRPSRRRRTS